MLKIREFEMTKVCLSSSLLIFASKMTATRNKEELLAVSREAGAFISRMIDSETVEQEIKRQKAFAPVDEFDGR